MPNLNHILTRSLRINMFQQYTLKNKAKVILVPQENIHSATVLVVYPVGSRYENAKLAGVSHYIEHLMFKGTKKRPNTLVLTREIDRLGAEYNAFTAKEHTGYYIKADSEFIETSLDILSDMLFNSKFDKKEMEREKTVIVEELRMYKDNPIMNIENVFEENLYQEPLGRDIGGSEKTVMGFARADVLEYKHKYYDPSNMIIVVSGNINESIKDLLDKYFGAEENKFNPSKHFAPAVFGSEDKTKRIFVEKKKTDQVQLMLGFPGFAYDSKEENTILGVLNTILGGSMSSRLFIQVRERRGLAYSIHSGVENFRDTGYACVRAGLEAKNVNKAIQVIKQEIEKIKNKGVTAQELADAKTHLRGHISLSMENSSAQASWYAGQALFLDKLETPEERLSRIDTVTQAQIKTLAKKVFNMKKMRVALIGDLEKNKVKF